MAAPARRRAIAAAALAIAAAIAAASGASGAFAVAAPKSLKVTGGVRNWMGNVDSLWFMDVYGRYN